MNKLFSILYFSLFVLLAISVILSFVVDTDKVNPKIMIAIVIVLGVLLIAVAIIQVIYKQKHR